LAIWVSPITGITLTLVVTFNAKAWTFTKGNKSKIQAMNMEFPRINEGKKEYDETIRNKILREVEFQTC
jgi:hypothetical protein